MKCGLLPLNQTAIRFEGHIGYHDYEGPAIDLAERERLVRDLAQVDAMAARTDLVGPYGVLEWPAMLRLLEAEQKSSAFPPYDA
jgi:hypothetical protein